MTLYNFCLLNFFPLLFRNSSLNEVSSPSSYNIISEGHLQLVTPGKLTWKINCSTSNLVSFFEPMSSKEDRRSTPRSRGASFQETRVHNEMIFTVTSEKKDDKLAVSEKQNIRMEESAVRGRPECSYRNMRTKNEAKNEDQETATEKKAALNSNSTKVSIRSLYEKSRNSIANFSLPATPTRTGMWKDAQKIYRALQTMVESRSQDSTVHRATDTGKMTVKQRAQQFGRTKVV